MAGKRKVWSTPLNTGNATADMGADRQRAFQELHDALLAVGLVQTADTGQLADFSGVTGDVPGATTVTYGYRIYRLNDSLQATSPVFLKVVFGARGGSSSGTWDVPNFGLEIGTGTDGTGNLVNSTGSYRFPNLYFNSSTATPSLVCRTGNLPSYAYSGEGLTWVMLKGGSLIFYGPGSTYIGRPGPVGGANDFPLLFFAIARPVGPDGLPKAGGAALLIPQGLGTSGTSGGFRYQAMAYTPNVWALSDGGTIRYTISPLSKAASDIASTVGGNLIVGTLHAVFDTGYEQLYGIGSVSAPAVASGDTVNVNLHGLSPIALFVPHRGVQGFNQLNSYIHNADGMLELDTPALAWEGDFV
ncbi:hypothetical protein IPC102_09415 [Pseudomonas aeruginosa]|uniref:hypothetical protein n=1 Tax=Pseudomonas aeruginosa TaxID=287 RepID=UPI000F53B177|nr:hypothetical protein [Pseudomonas aeruginosa]RQH69982.1 hypothetical protein IPC102_09415 [Pseudomonas aeruginosa]